MILTEYALRALEEIVAAALMLSARLGTSTQENRLVIIVMIFMILGVPELIVACMKVGNLGKDVLRSARMRIN